MSYQLSVNGHIEGENAEQQERDLLDGVKAFVSDMPGVTTAGWTGQFTGVVTLTPQPVDTAAAEEPVNTEDPPATDHPQE